MLLHTIFWVLFLFSTGLIAYQDFKTRLISVWLLVLYSIVVLGGFFIRGNTLEQLIENIFFCCIYFLFSYLILHLYFFLKRGSFTKIIDTMLGWGDVWVLVLMGLTLEITNLIFFFTCTFLVTILIILFFSAKKKEVALVGYLAIIYCLFNIIQFICLSHST